MSLCDDRESPLLPPSSSPDPTAVVAALDRVLGLIADCRFRHTDEKGLQRGIALLLLDELISFRREVRLGPGDVVDFLVGFGQATEPLPKPDRADRPMIGLEVKTAGTAPAVAAQLLRYAGSPAVCGLALVTTCSRHLIYRDIPTLGGKPFRAIALRGGF